MCNEKFCSPLHSNIIFSSNKHSNLWFYKNKTNAKHKKTTVLIKTERLIILSTPKLQKNVFIYRNHIIRKLFVLFSSYSEMHHYTANIISQHTGCGALLHITIKSNVSPRPTHSRFPLYRGGTLLTTSSCAGTTYLFRSRFVWSRADVDRH